MELVTADGPPYLNVLRELHRQRRPEWYLEIGTFTGDSLALSRSKTIAIDPRFKIRSNVFRGIPQCHLLQQTSDAAFESGILEALKVKLGLAFLDGLHLFEFLLRDFMNAERYMAPGGVIVLHDCVPRNVNMTVRDRAECLTPEWTGDVWKMIPVLRHYRPDLDVRVLDAVPTGLVAIRNLDSSSRVLWDRFDDILAEFRDLEFEDFGIEVFNKIAAIESSHDYLGIPKPKKPAVTPQRFAIRVAAPSPDAGKPWGEHAFGEGLAGALERLGHTARIDYIDGWKRAEPGETDLVIRGHGYRKRVYRPVQGRPACMWNIYPAWPEFQPREIEAFDHIWCASRAASKDLNATLLPQAFDAARMSPPETAKGADLVLVANNYERGKLRRMAEWALDAGLDLAVWGDGWKGTPIEPFVRGKHLPNTELADVYGNALAVLNDHANEMGETGFPSNRIFDALACGAPVISDPVAWLPEDLAPHVTQVASAPELMRAVLALRERFQDTRRKRLRLARAMRDTHSFDARAQDIAATTAKLAETAMEDVA